MNHLSPVLKFLLLGSCFWTQSLISSQSTESSVHYLDRYAPVAIYPLDQAPTAPTLSDTHGHFSATLHKKASGMPEQIQGAQSFTGKAWQFQGVDSSLRSETNGAYHTLGDIEASEGISIAFWMRLPLDGMQANHRLLGHPAVEAVISKIGYGGLGIHFGKGYRISLDRHSGYKAFDGQWHHIVATADFTSRRENVAIYLDGVEVARGDGASNTSFNATKPNTPFFIGARVNGGHTFAGALDDVALFNYALSSEQVQAIHQGPVYVGPAIDVYLPNFGQLKPITPDNTRIRWTQQSGPSEVIFEDPLQATSRVKFETPGSYELALQVEGFDASQVLSVTVHPPTAPTVSAGDPIQLHSTEDVAQLNASILVLGQNTEEANDLDIAWQAISGPGSVKFSHPAQATTQARFSAPGLYQLEVSATRSALSNTDTVSVLVGATDSPHYSRLLNPLYALPLDTPANRISAGINEVTGNTCAEMADSAGPLPQMLEGARPHTGHGWDLQQQDAKIKVHNRFNIARLGNVELTSGLSLSLWLKADSYHSQLGRIGGWSGVTIEPHKYSEGVSVTINDTTITTNPSDPKASKLYNSTWRHILATADFTSDQNNVRLYIDGQLVSQTSHLFDTIFGSERTDKTHYWGCRNNGGGYFFNGQLDDIIVFDRALNEAEVTYLYNGPNDVQRAQLLAPRPQITAGPDQVHRLPTTSVTLEAQALEGSNLHYEWSLLRGPGDVTIKAPHARSTQVKFGPLDRELHNTDYRQYLFKLTARIGTESFTPTNTDIVSVVLYDNHAPPTRALSSVPAAGVHPRVLFSPEDLPAMRQRFANDPYAQEAARLLQTTYDSTLFNTDSVMGQVYQLLKNGAEDVDVKFVVGDNDTRSYWQGKTWLYGSLAGAASIALIQEDDATLQEYATVLSNATKEHLKYYRPNYPNKLIHDASGGLALAYDFLHNHMTEAQRAPTRLLLSKMTKWRQSFGSAAYAAHNNATNWKTHHDQIVLAALAIEGEDGDDPEFIQAATDKLRTFFSQYGVFKSGYAHEGYTYYLMGTESAALSALALSRREENLYETTHLFSSAMMMFRCMPPQSPWITGHGDASPRISSMAPLDWTLRYLWPDNPAVQYLTQSRLDQLMQVDTSPKDKNQSLNLMAVLFAVGSKELQSQAESAAANELPDSQFCPDKGYLNARNNWSDSGVNFTFRSRQDKYALGHMHPDVNSFELYANGDTWFWDPGKYSIYNDFHQTILVDGTGGGGSSDAFVWPSLPGKIVEYTKHDDLQIIAGDAKAFYDYVYSDLRAPKPGQQKLQAVSTEAHGLLWSDFIYGKTGADADELPRWRSSPINAEKGLYAYNSMQRAYRSAAFSTGTAPYLLLVDDYQKDQQARLYEWVGNFKPGTIEVVSQTSEQIILKQADDRHGNRLLVRILEMDGSTDGPQLIDTKLGDMPATQLRIAAQDTTAPNFKLLIYPYIEGTSLPQTEFNGSKLQLTIGEQVDRYTFTARSDGRTQITPKN